MAVLGISAVGMQNVAGAGAPKPAAQKFGEVMKAANPARQPNAAQLAKAGPPQVKAMAREAVISTPKTTAAQAIDRVTAAQTRMDKVLELAQSGKTFSPAELLALQTQMYRASQELDLAGKVVEKATGGVKQVLQTQV